MSKPLVSIIILCYKNYHYLFHAIDSVINQDYLNIELIINNDGSDDFQESAVNEYLKRHKRKNLKNIIIRNNIQNFGTVKSLNTAIKLATGEYILAFAGDDVIFDQTIVSKFVNSFSKLPKEEYIVTSQVLMCDELLNKQIQLFVSKSHKKILKFAKPNELFNKMATKCIVAACGTCFKKSIFQKFGYFDEKYKLVEDYSSALRFSRLGIKYNFFDFISFKHRDGGISHGNVGGPKKLNKQYDLDILNIMKNEILPYLYLLDEDQKQKFLKAYKDYQWRFKYKYKFENGTKAQRRIYIKNNIGTIVQSFNKDIKEYFIDQLEGKKLKVFLFGIFLLIVYSIKMEPLYLGSFNIQYILKYLGLFFIIESIILVIYQIYKICWDRIIFLIKSFL